MDLTNRDRITKAFEYLQSAMRPFVEGEMRATYREEFPKKIDEILGEKHIGKSKDRLADPPALLVIMRDKAFRSRKLKPSARNLVRQILDIRGRWAHFEEFSNSDTEKALDTVARLLAAVSAPQVAEIRKMKGQLRCVIYSGIAQIIPNVIEDGQKGIRIRVMWSYQDAWKDATYRVQLCFFDDERTERTVCESRSIPPRPARIIPEGHVDLKIVQMSGFVLEADLPNIGDTLNYECCVRVLVRYEDRPGTDDEELWRSDDLRFLNRHARMLIGPASQQNLHSVVPGSLGARVVPPDGRPKR